MTWPAVLARSICQGQGQKSHIGIVPMGCVCVFMCVCMCVHMCVQYEENTPLEVTTGTVSSVLSCVSMCPFFLCVSSAFAPHLRQKNAPKVISVGVSPCVQLRYPLLIPQKNLPQRSLWVVILSD